MHAIENWDDDDAFDFSSNPKKEATCDKSQHRLVCWVLRYKVTLIWDWDNLVQNSDLRILQNVLLNDDDASSSTVSNQFEVTSFSAEDGEEEEDDHPSNFLLTPLRKAKVGVILKKRYPWRNTNCYIAKNDPRDDFEGRNFTTRVCQRR